MFLIFPALLRYGVGFWAALILSSLLWPTIRLGGWPLIPINAAMLALAPYPTGPGIILANIGNVECQALTTIRTKSYQWTLPIRHAPVNERSCSQIWACMLER